MKNIKWNSRVLIWSMVMVMIANSIPSYAAEQSGFGSEYEITEKIGRDDTESNIPVIDDNAISEDDFSIEGIRENILISEETQVQENSLEEQESEVELNEAEYELKLRIDEVTRSNVKGVVNVNKTVDEENVYLIIEFTDEKTGTTRSSYILPDDTQTSYEFEFDDLFADTEYVMSAYLQKNYNLIIGTSETVNFHTVENGIEFEMVTTVSEITQNSAIVTVNLSEDTIERLQQENINSAYATIRYGMEGEQASEAYINFYSSNNYSKSVTLNNLCAGEKYHLDVILKFYGTYGNTLMHSEFSTLASDITCTLDVDGNTIGTGFINFSMEGYEEGKEYILDVYVSKNHETKSFFERAYLNSENGYKFQSERVIFEEMGCVYEITGDLKDASTYQRLLLLERKTVEIPFTKIFDVTVLEDSITYNTAKVDIEWIDTNAILNDEIQIYVEPYMEVGIYATLNKENKRKTTIQFTNLKVGKENHITLSVEMNGIWKELENFQITTKTHQFEKFTEVEFPTQLEIARKWKELHISLKQADTYEKNVNHTDGGVLSKKTLQNALNITNFIRYVAGLPDDVVCDKEWSSICNAGSELNRLHGELNHYPSKPSGVTKTFYDRGYLGTSSSNLAAGSKNLADSILLYMIDPGESNYSKGHRTWILKPHLGVVGFGRSQNYYSMYVTEGQYTRCTREVDFSQGYYYWPAYNMPMELYTDDYWTNYGPSLYLSSEYDSMKAEDITLQVKSKKLGKTWNLKGNQGTYGKGPYMRIYGNYLVFDTGMYPKGDTVTVTVKGTTINGEDAPIVYTMNFFSLADIDVSAIPVESVTVSSDITEVCEGESIKIKAKVLPTDATNKQLSWTVESVDGKGKASISQDGVLTAMLEGEVKVTATSKENKKIFDSLILRIKEKHIPVEKISFAKESIRLEKGATYSLPAILIPADTTENHITYSSSDESKVTVKEGIITALDTTNEPVIIRAVIGELSAECQVEVYEETKEEVDRHYSTRITQILVKGETNLKAGEEQIIKIYPVTNGYELEPEEFEILLICNEKKLNIEPIESSDLGYWYQVTGIKNGEEKVTVIVNTKFAESETIETVKKQLTFKVLKNKADNMEESSQAPVLVSSNISINQNQTLGTKLDLRFKEDNIMVDKIYLTSQKQDGTEELFVITQEENDYYLQTKEIGKNKNYQLVLHLENAHGAWEYPIKVTTKRSFPQVSIKQTKKPNVQLLYEDAVFSITGKEKIDSVSYSTASLDFVQEEISGKNKDYQLVLKQQEHGKKIDKKGTVSILFEGYRVPTERKITIATFSKKVKVDTLIAVGNKVILNSASENERTAAVYVKLENSEKLYPDKIFVTASNKNSANLLENKDISFTYNKHNGKLQVTTKIGVKAGNYSFTYSGMVQKAEVYTDTSGKIKITVSISEKQPTITLKASGSIDLINRSQSFVIYTPTIKSVSGKVAAVELTGENAKYFYARVTTEGKIKLFARMNAKLIPKQNYEVGIRVMLDSGYEFEEQIVKAKPKQSTFKVAAKEKTITLCKNENKPYLLDFMVKSPTMAEISYVKPVSIPEGFEYNRQKQTLKIADSSKVKSKKTYSITFEVTPKGAYRSIKPAKVTVKVKVLN